MDSLGRTTIEIRARQRERGESESEKCRGTNGKWENRFKSRGHREESHIEDNEGDQGDQGQGHMDKCASQMAVKAISGTESLVRHDELLLLLVWQSPPDLPDLPALSLPVHRGLNTLPKTKMGTCSIL